MSFLVYLGGGALLGALMRWWCPRPGWRWIAAYWLAAGAFFAAPLLTSKLQVPSDIAYQWRPWREMVPEPVVPANGLLSDVPLQIIPFRALVRDRLLRGEAPLWAGEMGTGEPLLGNAQSAPFSPLGLLALPLPPVRALPVMAALKLFVSLLLTDALLAALGAGRAGACFAAIAFAFSVYSICWALYPLGMAAAWLPGVVLGLVLLRRGERGGLAGLVVCAGGMALSGHPETLAHAALAAAVVAAALLLGRVGGSGGGATRWRFAGGLAAAAAMSAGLAAPALLPFVEALPDTVRAQLVERSSQGVQPPAFTPAILNLAIDPLAYGSPGGSGWTGPSNFNELCSGYAGLLALALAAAAALTFGGRLLAILAGGAVALAAAQAIPPFLQLVRALPPLDYAANGRLRLIWVLAVAVAAGLALERLAARPAGRWIAGAAAAAAALGLVCERPPGLPWERAWWLATAGGAALTAAAFWWAAVRATTRATGSARRPRESLDEVETRPAECAGLGSDPAGRPSGSLGGGLATAGRPDAARWLPWLAVACLAVDLGLLDHRLLPVLPSAFDLAPPPAVAAMTAEMRDGAGAGAAFRVVAEGDALRPGLAALYGLWDPRFNDPMEPGRASLVVGRLLRERYRLGTPMLLMQRPYPVPSLRYLGVRLMLTRHRAELFPPWEEAWDGQGGKLWRNPEALPLFFMPAAWRPAHDPGDALLATVANQDFAAAAVAELGEILDAGGGSSGGSRDRGPLGAGPVGAAPSGSGGKAGGSGPSGPAGKARAPAAPPPVDVHQQAGRVQIRSLHANGFDLEAGGATGGLVVSSVTFCRGWRLTLDGRPAALLRVNAGFLGFLVPAGWHRAALEYRPAGWVWGLRWCWMTLGVTLAASLVRARIARRPRPGRPG